LQNNNEPLDKPLLHSPDPMRTPQETVVLSTCDLVSLIQAIRQYQYLSHFHLTPEPDINPIWVNDVIERVKRVTGKTLMDEDL